MHRLEYTGRRTTPEGRNLCHVYQKPRCDKWVIPDRPTDRPTQCLPSKMRDRQCLYLYQGCPTLYSRHGYSLRETNCPLHPTPGFGFRCCSYFSALLPALCCLLSACHQLIVASALRSLAADLRLRSPLLSCRTSSQAQSALIAMDLCTHASPVLLSYCNHIGASSSSSSSSSSLSSFFSVGFAARPSLPRSIFLCNRYSQTRSSYLPHRYNITTCASDISTFVDVSSDAQQAWYTFKSQFCVPSLSLVLAFSPSFCFTQKLCSGYLFVMHMSMLSVCFLKFCVWHVHLQSLTLA